MRTFRRRSLAAGAGALITGCALAGAVGAPAASAATGKPGVVQDFAVKSGSVTTDGATLTWARDARATSYRVIIVNASTPTTAAAFDSGYQLDGTSLTVSSLAPGTAYEASISAKNSGGASAWSQWIMFYTTASSGVVSVKTYSLVADSSGDSESIPTGGSFTAKAKSVGTVALTGGTYLLNLNFMATPDATTTGAVYPQAFVYDGTTIAADFSNDLFNIGSGALAPYNAADAGDQVNSYYSGSSVITVPAGGETLDLYGFGYDSDHGAGSYEMNSATLTATELTPATAAS
jgi:hypothetical protein